MASHAQYTVSVLHLTASGLLSMADPHVRDLEREDPLGDWCRQLWDCYAPSFTPGPGDAVVALVDCHGRWLSRSRSEHGALTAAPAADTTPPPEENPALRWDGWLQRLAWVSHSSAMRGEPVFAQALLGHRLDCTREWVLELAGGAHPVRRVSLALRCAVYLCEASGGSPGPDTAPLVAACQDGPTVDVVYEDVPTGHPARPWCSAGPGSGSLFPCSLTPTGLEAPSRLRTPEAVGVMRGL